MRFHVALLLVALTACRAQESAGPDSVRSEAPKPAVREAAVLEGAKVPFIVADPAGGFLVSHVSEETFRIARVQDGRWSEAKAVAGGDLLVNSADFPSIASDGATLRASWSTRNQHGSVIHLAQSSDGGSTWSSPVTPHPEMVSQFGFVSLVAGESVWLDGRKLKGGVEGDGDMELRASDALLDARVCDCCQTAAAMTSDGPVVAYRDRSDGEVRDIAYVRRRSSGWSEPKLLHADGWKIEGCPVNGPQLDARGRSVVAAWFTAANNEPRVNVAFSEDAGATFSAPVRVDLGKSTGHVDVAFLGDSTAVVTFLDGGALHARRVSPDGNLGAPLRIAETRGFPRMAVSQENVGVVWTSGDGVHFATLEGF